VTRKFVDIVVHKNGGAQFLHDDAAASIMQGLGPISTKRASHVEPFDELSAAAKAELQQTRRFYVTGRAVAKSTSLAVPPPPSSLEQLRAYFVGKWFADLTPVSGPVAGPFDTRAEALQYEKGWVEQHVLGINFEQRDSGQSATDVRDSARCHTPTETDVQGAEGEGQPGGPGALPEAGHIAVLETDAGGAGSQD